MKLSIITISYNNLSGLKRTAESILSQTWKDYEWIVIDGGSTDGTKKFLTLLERQPDYWCSEKDQGIYDAMNKGLYKANGQYSLFLNGGDCLYDEKVLENFFAIHSDADVIYGDLAFASKGSENIYHYPDELNIYFLLQRSLGHPASFFKTETLKEIGGYDTNLKICSDWKVFVQYYIKGNIFEHKNLCVSRFFMDGISCNNDDILTHERDAVLKELMTTPIREGLSPKVSVIIPCYNQAHYLKETVTSVINQSYQNWEMIIINDGSTDDSENVALECVAADSRISYHLQENKGASASRNKGVNLSSGKYILPLDSDDTIEKDYIVKAVEYFEEHSECVCFYCLANMFGEVSKPWDVRYTGYKDLLLNNAIFCSSLYRRSDFDRIGGYDETFLHGYEDWEFYIRLLADGDKVYQDEMRMFNYRQKIAEEASLDSLSHQHEEDTLNHIYCKHIDIYTKYFGSFIANQRKPHTLTIENNRLLRRKKRYKKLAIYLAVILVFMAIALAYLLIQ